MPNGLDDLARLMNPFERGHSDIRRILLSHSTPEKADKLLQQLDECWENNKSSLEVVGEELLKVFPILDERSARSQIVIQGLRQLPSRFPHARDDNFRFSGVWPIELASFAVDGGLHPHFEVIPNKYTAKSVDLFLEPKSGEQPHFGFQKCSARTTDNGVDVLGLAVECKSLQSIDKAGSNFMTAMKQIRPFRGGIVAFDISNLICEQLNSGSRVGHDAFDGQSWSYHMQLHEKINTVVGHRKRDESWTAPLLVGHLTHAHVFSPERATVGNEKSRQFTVYRRVAYCPNPQFVNSTAGGKFDHQGFFEFLKHMFRDCRTWERVDAGEGKLYMIPEGQSLEAGFDNAFNAAVNRYPDESKERNGDTEGNSSRRANTEG